MFMVDIVNVSVFKHEVKITVILLLNPFATGISRRFSSNSEAKAYFHTYCLHTYLYCFSKDTYLYLLYYMYIVYYGSLLFNILERMVGK